VIFDQERKSWVGKRLTEELGLNDLGGKHSVRLNKGELCTNRHMQNLREEQKQSSIFKVLEVDVT
jgi:hypothetical protein